MPKRDEFTTVSIDKIIVKARARVDMGEDFPQLVESIRLRGQMNPLLLHKKDFQLLAGFRRLTALQQLGHTEAKVRFYEDLTPVDKKIIEVEENIHKTLTWDERAKLYAEIHALQQDEHGKRVKGHKSGGWGLADSAEMLGLSEGNLSKDLTLADALEVLPELGKLSSRRQALKMVDRIQEAAILSEIARRDEEDVTTVGSVSKPYTMHRGDAVKYLKEMVEDETIDLVIFDPPWGVHIHEIASSRGPKGEKTSYKDDSEDTAVNLALNLLPEIHRVMKEDAHMYMFIGVQYRDYYLDILTNFDTLLKRIDLWKTLFPEADKSLSAFKKEVERNQKLRDWKFHVEEVPLIWVKEGGGYTDFEHKFMPRYEAVLFCSKGIKKRLNEVTSNVFEVQRPLTTERTHTQEKPLELIQKFIKVSSQPHEIVLDPCAGSFSTTIAATLMGRRSIAIDNDELCYIKGMNRVKGLLEINDGDVEKD